MRKIFTAGLFFSFIPVFFGVYSLPWVSAETSPHVECGSIMSKLDKIEANQTELLKRIEELKSELQIVKIRVSSR